MDNDPSTSTVESSSHDGIPTENVAVSSLTPPYPSTDHTSAATQSSNPGDNLFGQYVSPALLTSETTGLMDNTPSNVDITAVPTSSSSFYGASRTTTTVPMIQSVPSTKTSAGPPTVSPYDYIYHIKWICFRGASRPIVTQNENGPCPMIAIANVLLLRGTMNIPEGSELLTGQRLVSLLSEILLSPPCLESEQLLNYETTVSDALNLFPSLQTGLDINVRFTGVSAFEFTPALSIFDLFKIPLYHGWLVEPEDMALSSIIGGRSYNQLAERIIELKASADPELKNQGALAEDFLDQTASQLTYHGLCELSSTVSEGQLAVFFRNNHFNTIFKNDGRIYVLVTDMGLINEPEIVWEALDDVDVAPHEDVPSSHAPVSGSHNNASDTGEQTGPPKSSTTGPSIHAPNKITKPESFGEKCDTSIEQLEKACTEHLCGRTPKSLDPSTDLAIAARLQLEEIELSMTGTTKATTGRAPALSASGKSGMSSDKLTGICSERLLEQAKQELGSGSDLDVAIRLQVEEVERLNLHQTIRKRDDASLPTQPYPVRSSAVGGSPTTTHNTIGKFAPHPSSTIENRSNCTLL
ncbi:hypothetical protein EG68_03027 [Paragonimus skrjabini miyazakii]|uniref:Ubiquitin carboxyl-terminal hydrolase n=1 Tax=Paragonimus skrjabini miyazakii TaxID=59628 RepID=A0A8S9YW33_9TREM|nr:hypothetical protein EG68_03027 [Paragonimus skrjabini miyazakii]